MATRTRGRPPVPIDKRAPPRRSSKARKLTPGQLMFIERYLICSNATEAYRDSFPNVGAANAGTSGSSLLRHPLIAAEIRRRVAAITKKYKPTADNVLKEMAACAFSNIRDMVDHDGKLIPMHALPVHVTAALKKIKTKEITSTNLVTGEEKVIGHLREIEMTDKILPLRLIGQHQGMFAEQHDVNVNVSFHSILEKAAERLIEPE